jgi:hypothetical protein
MTMKKLLTLFMCFALVGLYSCSSDDDNDNGTNTGLTLKVRSLYSDDANSTESKPDTGAKVYLFFDFDKNTPNGYTYQLGGKYVKDKVTMSPDQTGVTDADGYATINTEFKNRPLTVVVESKHYEGQYIETYYKNFNESEILALLFKPK